MNMMMMNDNRNDTSKNAYILVYEKIVKKPIKLISSEDNINEIS